MPNVSSTMKKTSSSPQCWRPEPKVPVRSNGQKQNFLLIFWETSFWSSLNRLPVGVRIPVLYVSTVCALSWPVSAVDLQLNVAKPSARHTAQGSPNEKCFLISSPAPKGKLGNLHAAADVDGGSFLFRVPKFLLPPSNNISTSLL